MNNSRKVLLFQLSKYKEKQIKTLCDRLDLQVITVPLTDYSKTLGQLTGIQNSVPSNNSGQSIPKLSSTLPGLGVPQMEMLLFSGFSSDLLDVFLAEYKKAAIDPIPLKAVVTPANSNWDVRTLYSELLKEHMQIDKLFHDTKTLPLG